MLPLFHHIFWPIAFFLAACLLSVKQKNRLRILRAMYDRVMRNGCYSQPQLAILIKIVATYVYVALALGEPRRSRHDCDSDQPGRASGRLRWLRAPEALGFWMKPKLSPSLLQSHKTEEVEAQNTKVKIFTIFKKLEIFVSVGILNLKRVACRGVVR